MRTSNIALWLFCATVPYPARAEAAAGRASVVVTTTLIETAVRDLLGPDIPVVRLLPAGACPGHFDLDPGHAGALAAATLLVRHDYQAGLDAGVAKAGLETSRLVSVSSRPAFTIPSNYVAMCEELAARFTQTWPDQAAGIRTQLAEVRRKAAAEGQRQASRAERLALRKALCARYQRDFCQWLGLNAVAVFQAGADESAWQLNRAVDMAKAAGAEVVIGNRQWGPRHLQALTEAAGLPGIMLSNFPDDGEAGAYWRLLDANVTALLKGLP